MCWRFSHFLDHQGVKPEDMVNLPPETGFPESVIDLLSGNLGQPMGGWPKAVQKVVLGKRKPMRGRPGASAPKIDLKKEFSSLQKKIGRKATEDDLFAHLMYPQVFRITCLSYQKWRCLCSSHHCLFPRA